MNKIIRCENYAYKNFFLCVPENNSHLLELFVEKNIAKFEI